MGNYTILTIHGHVLFSTLLVVLHQIWIHCRRFLSNCPFSSAKLGRNTAVVDDIFTLKNVT
jgi:hypothetical protein